MRKIVVGMLLSLDGVAEAPDRFFGWDDAIEAPPSRRATPAGPDAEARLMAAAKAAGYRLDKLMTSLRDSRAATSKTAGGKPRAPKAGPSSTTERPPKPARPTKRRRP